MGQNAEQLTDGMYEDKNKSQELNSATDIVVDASSLPEPKEDEMPETKPDEASGPNEEPESKPEDVIEGVIADLEVEQPQKPETVPLATFLEVKNELRATRDEVNQLKGRQEGFERATREKPADDKPTTIAGLCKKHGLDPEDAVPIKIFEELENNRREAAEIQRQKEQEENTRRINAVIQEADTQAKTTYAPGKVPKGQEYETIVKLGSGFLTDMDTRMIRVADNPAIELYKRCKVRAAEAIPSLKEHFFPPKPSLKTQANKSAAEDKQANKNPQEEEKPPPEGNDPDAVAEYLLRA